MIASAPDTRLEYDLLDLEETIFAYDPYEMDQRPVTFVTEKLCFVLCKLAKPLLMKEMTMLEVESPVFVVGDIHGQFRDFMRILDYFGVPPSERVLFLGDYVDRGDCSLEVICTLLLLKINHPENVLLLRGNHEFLSVNCRYGFKDECYAKFGQDDVYHCFNDLFNCLPMAAIIDGSYFCCHGGISEAMLTQSTYDIRQLINRINRPLVSLRNLRLETDLMWSDPMNEETDFGAMNIQPLFMPSSRGISYKFNVGATEAFLQQYSLKGLVRAHQVKTYGLSVQHNDRCITVFSAPGYFNRKNYGAVMLFHGQPTEKIKDAFRIVQFKPLRAEGNDE